MNWPDSDPTPGNRSASGPTPNPPGELRTIALSASGRPVGILALRGLPTSSNDRAVLNTFANDAALALERAQLREQALRSKLLEEVDRFRHGLMGAVSHDLRTPLGDHQGRLLDARQQVGVALERTSWASCTTSSKSSRTDSRAWCPTCSTSRESRPASSPCTPHRRRCRVGARGRERHGADLEHAPRRLDRAHGPAGGERRPLLIGQVLDQSARQRQSTLAPDGVITVEGACARTNHVISR
jgi:hypothetical protein